MRKRKILFYTRAPAGGGAERVWSMLASHFARRGDEICVALDFDGDRAGLDPSIRVEILGGGTGSVWQLARLLRSFRPEIALSAVSGNATKLVVAKKLARSPATLVISFHGFEEYRTGKWSAAAYFGLRLLQPAITRIVAVSDGLRAALLNRWGADPARTVRIYNPVPIAVAPLDEPTLASRVPKIVAVGRLSAEKGFLDLVEAFARLHDADATLTIAGEGPERAALEARIDALGLSGRVSLPGFLDPTSLYREARLCVIPSRSEAFGMVAVEALAAGLPVVATDCDGPREVLGGLGTLVPVGDIAALAAAIDAALAAAPGDPALRQARAEMFSAEVGFRAWERLVDEVIGR